MKGWNKLSEERILDHNWLKVYKDKVRINNARRSVTNYLRLDFNDVTSTVVYEPNSKKFILNLEYSYLFDDRIHREKASNPFDGWIFKFPGGVNMRDEKPRDAAVREIEEETGLIVDIKEELGVVRYPRANSKNYKYFAEVVSKGYIKRDDEEAGMTIEWYTEKEIDKMVIDKYRRVMHAGFLDTWSLYKSLLKRK